MTVFTVFNHGTSASRDKEGEIVAEFGRLAAGQEYRDFLICDGPGSAPKTSVMPGQFNPYTRDKQAKSVMGNKELGHTHINWQLTGMAYGSGWDDNVIHAIATICELDPLPHTINMLGWSRGAVTCTKLAYRLEKIYPQIDINIFAVDPVAGIGHKADEDASTIHGNVKNYCAILSMHETRRFFKPQDAQRVKFTSENTNAVFLPFPGNHEGQVKLDKYAGKDIGEAAQMVWFLAWRFLESFGTKFREPPSPGYQALEQCNMYARMRIKMRDYQETSPGIGASVIFGGPAPREAVAKRIEQYVGNPAYFINEHHRTVFKRTLPDLYNWVFAGIVGDRAAVMRDFMKTRFFSSLNRTLTDMGFQLGDLNGGRATLPLAGGGRETIRLDGRQIRADMSAMGLFPY